MMIKVVFLGMMAACAMAQFPMMGMGMGGFGGLDLKNIKNMIPEGTFDMIKNMKKEDIQNALQNMPPEMADMMKGMGISEDQIKDAVNNIPDDADSLADMLDGAKDKMGDLLDNVKEQMDAEKDVQINDMKEEVKKQLEESGIDLSEGPEGLINQIIPEFTKMMEENLKEEGINTEDKEGLREALRKEIREFAGAEEGDSDEDVKDKLMKGLLEEMKQNGFDINTDNPSEGFEGMKKEVIDQLKEFGIEIEGASSPQEMIQIVMKNIHPQEIMAMIGPMMQGPMMQGPMMGGPMMGGPMMEGPRMMGPPEMGVPPMEMNLDLELNMQHRPEVPFVTPTYIRGAEDTLLRVFGDDSEVTRHVMAVKYGAETGNIMEEDLHEILRDLMHYRLEARVLMAKNQLLRNRLDGPMF